MKLASVKGSNGNGFTITAKVLEIGLKVKSTVDGKEVEVDAVRVQKVSGKDPGAEFIVTLQPPKNPESKANKFDKDGLIALKIKQPSANGKVEGTLVSLVRCTYTSKQGEPASLQTQRMTKAGNDYKPEDSLMLTAWAENVANLTATIISPKQGSHAVVSGTVEEKTAAVKGLTDTVSKSLNDDQGLAIIVGGKLEDGTAVTLQTVISRYVQKQESKLFEKLDATAFAAKVSTFLSEGNLANFAGTLRGPVSDVLSGGDLTVAVVPSLRVAMTGAQYLDDGQTSIRVGISSTGVPIEKATETREYDIIIKGALEPMGLASKRFPDAKVVIASQDKYIIDKVISQIDMHNGVTQTADAKDDPKPQESADPLDVFDDAPGVN